MKNILMATFWMFVFFSVFYVLTMGYYGLLIFIPVILSLYLYITKNYTKDIFFYQKNITILYKRSVFYKFFFEGIPWYLSKDLSDSERKNNLHRFMSFILLLLSIIILSLPIVMQRPVPSSIVIEEGRIESIKDNLFLNHCGTKIVEIIYSNNTRETFFCQINIKHPDKISKESNYKFYISRIEKIIPFCNLQDTILAINGPGINRIYNNETYKRVTQASIFSFTVGFITLFFSIILLYPLFDTYKARNNKGE